MAKQTKGAVAIAWFRREDYQRIREVSNDEMIPSFDDWEAKMTKMIANLAAQGIAAEKMVIDPDELVTFAKGTSDGKIDTKVRGAFAAMLFKKKHGTDH